MNHPIDEFRKRMNEGMSQSEVIYSIQHSGLSIIEAIKLVRELFGISLGAAKDQVASHPAYSEFAKASDPLHEELIRFFQKSGEPNSNET